MLENGFQLQDLGIHDYMVAKHFSRYMNPNSDVRRSVLPTLLSRAFQLLFFGLAVLPTMVMGMPLFVLTGVITQYKRKEALAKSTVKVAARDVVGTWKVGLIDPIVMMSGVVLEVTSFTTGPSRLFSCSHEAILGATTFTVDLIMLFVLHHAVIM